MKQKQNISVLDHLIRNLEKILHDERLDTEQKLLALPGAYWSLYENDPIMLVNLCNLQSSDLLNTLSPNSMKRINSLTSEVIIIVKELFERAISEGKIVDHNPAAFVDIIWGFFSGLVLWEESKQRYDPKKGVLGKV